MTDKSKDKKSSKKSSDSGLERFGSTDDDWKKIMKGSKSRDRKPKS